MKADRSVRSLSALSTASSSRVLNLVAIAEANADNEGHRTAPLFVSSVFNHSLILKHRLRAGEVDSFAERRALATKVIIPFERHDLKCGGHSLFLGQSGFEELVREIGNYRGQGDLKRDLDVMRMIDSLPSLDPFLLREHLRCGDIYPDACYFATSDADKRNMYDYAAQELERLTMMANGSKWHGATGRMVSALLSNDVDERLEPLRVTLGLRPAEFSEGVFSWRGFIYYKWSLDKHWPQLIRAMKGIRTILPIGKMTGEERAILEASKNVILRGAKANSLVIRKIISIYDTAYAHLVEHHNPKLFRDFLLGAPQLFLEIGERMGALSHIASTWNHGFPMGAPRTADASELIAILRDFAKSLTPNSGYRAQTSLGYAAANRVEAATAAMTMIQDGSFAKTRSAKLAAASAASRQLVMALVKSGE